MAVDYLSSQPNRAEYQVSTKQGSGPSIFGNAEVTAQLDRATHGDAFHRAYILSEVLEETGGDEHSYEEDLVRLSMFGTKVPTQDDVSAATADSRALISSATAVGWGKHLFVLEAEANS